MEQKEYIEYFTQKLYVDGVVNNKQTAHQDITEMLKIVDGLYQPYCSVRGNDSIFWLPVAIHSGGDINKNSIFSLPIHIQGHIELQVWFTSKNLEYSTEKGSIPFSQLPLAEKQKFRARLGQIMDILHSDRNLALENKYYAQFGMPRI